jgi:hypothetical protein
MPAFSAPAGRGIGTCRTLRSASSSGIWPRGTAGDAASYEPFDPADATADGHDDPAWERIDQPVVAARHEVVIDEFVGDRAVVREGVGESSPVRWRVPTSGWPSVAERMVRMLMCRSASMDCSASERTGRR